MRLLIVGQLNGQIGLATKIAISRGAKVAHATTIDQAMAELRDGRGADLLMVDVAQPIAQLVTQLALERIHVPIVACGIGTDAAAAVEAIKGGAKEYIPLPPDAQLIAAVLAAVSDESHQLIFEDKAMASVIALAEQVAPSEASILITGESGTGKEVLAHLVHRKSHRADKQFISINCAAIPDNLLESELFGHEKGAFTGAVARRIGKFEEADGGTLLLDEISEMDVRLQAKLLRVLQERVIDRVGGTQPIKIDIRILASTNRDLEGEVRAGRFREDLYFRLNVVTVRLPPLRARPLDIDVLAEHFMRKYAEANGTDARAFAPEAMAMLRGHTWRGNVRELENTVHRAVLLAKSPVVGPEAIVLQGATRPEDRPGAPAASGGSASGGAKAGLVGRTVDDVERELILDTLTHCLGNRTHAANILGISIRTLRNKLKIYNDQGFAPPAPPSGGEPRAAF
ncbi:MAG: sigma-54 dependent transcriptional regulator [Alphaproteobacteria bacterium]|nr:sigma-54 dependent transcriptional regulator [Alphaproteobacteria bacterium]